MSKIEAELFSITSSISILNGTIFRMKKDLTLNFYSDFGIKYNSLSTLRSAGLLLPSDSLNVTYVPNTKLTVDGELGVIIQYIDISYFINHLTNKSYI